MWIGTNTRGSIPSNIVSISEPPAWPLAWIWMGSWPCVSLTPKWESQFTSRSSESSISTLNGSVWARTYVEPGSGDRSTGFWKP